jgi:hypothetical protein
MLWKQMNVNKGIYIISSRFDSRVWILEHFSLLRIRYTNLKGEVLRIINVRKQQSSLSPFKIHWIQWILNHYVINNEWMNEWMNEHMNHWVDWSKKLCEIRIKI